MIRRVCAEDADRIALICKEEMGYACDPTMVQAHILGLDACREAVFVAMWQEQVVGFVHVEKYQILYHDTMANILGLAVLKECQGQGTGRKLMEAAEAWAIEQGIREMRLNSGADRVDAHAFYRHIGFTMEKGQKRFIKQMIE